MNIKIFVIPAMAIIAAELVCTLCNVNTAMKHVSDIKMQAGTIVSATGSNEVASAEDIYRFSKYVPGKGKIITLQWRNTTKITTTK